MLIHPRFNRFISRMKQIWELWDLLRKPWDSLDGFEMASSESDFEWECNEYENNSLFPWSQYTMLWFGEMSQVWMIWKTPKQYLYHMARSRGIFCAAEKSSWEKESFAITCILLLLSLNCSLFFDNGRCCGTAKVTGYTCCLWNYVDIAVSY